MIEFRGFFSRRGDRRAEAWRRKRKAAVEVSGLEARMVMSQLGAIGVTASPDVLWPPNGRVVPTVVTVRGSEVGSPPGALPGNTTLVYSVTDSEGQLTTGAREVPASEVVDQGGRLSFVVPLVSSRAGQDHDGRHYVITVTAVNPSLNETVGTASTVVTVPHDMGHGIRGGGGGAYLGGGSSNPRIGNRYEAALLARQERLEARQERLEARRERLEARRELFGNRPIRQLPNPDHGRLPRGPAAKFHGGRNFKVPPGHIDAVRIMPNYLAAGSDQGSGHGHGLGNGHGHGRR